MSRLQLFLDEKQFFHYIYFSFHPKHSTEHAFTALLKFIHKALDEGRVLAPIFLDIRKAFDSMLLTIILSKMEHIGIQGTIIIGLKLIYLKSRISIDQKFQYQFCVDFDDPQVSIYRIFLIFLNDLYITESRKTKRNFVVFVFKILFHLVRQLKTLYYLHFQMIVLLGVEKLSILSL